MRKFLPAIAVLSFLAASPLALAADKAPAPKADKKAEKAEVLTTEGLSLGKPVCGPEVAAKDLKGKVVVMEYWGDRCPPCIAAIPHLCEVQKKFGREKVIIVANQVWTQDAGVAKKVWEERAPKEYQVSVVNHGGVKGASVRGVPHAFVFGKDGKLVWRGHPGGPGLEKAIKDAVGE